MKLLQILLKDWNIHETNTQKIMQFLTFRTNFRNGQLNVSYVINNFFFIFFFFLCNYHLVCFRFIFEKNYPRCNSDDVIMGHIKINNNIPVSPDKWIYEQDINPITVVNDMTFLFCFVSIQKQH